MPQNTITVVRFALALALILYLFMLLEPDFQFLFAFSSSEMISIFLLSLIVQYQIFLRFRLMIHASGATKPENVTLWQTHALATLLNYLPLPVGVGYRLNFIASQGVSWRETFQSFALVTTFWIVSASIIVLAISVIALSASYLAPLIIFFLVLLMLTWRLFAQVLVTVVIEMLAFALRFVLFSDSLYDFPSGLLVYVSNVIGSVAGILPGGLGLSELIGLWGATILNFDASIVFGFAVFSRVCDLFLCLIIMIALRLHSCFKILRISR